MRRVLAASLVATFAVAFVPLATARHDAPRSAPRLTVLVVAGQSNALGFQSYVVDPVTHRNVFDPPTRADRRVKLVWDESGVTSYGSSPVRLDSPQRLAAAPSPVFGPEVGLARYLYAHGRRSMLVVKVAFSGSSLATDWAKGAADYDAMVTVVDQAMAWGRAKGYHPVIGAFYWMQGETDAMAAATASAYRANLTAFLTDVRSSLSLSPGTPFVIGEIDLTDYIDYESAKDLCPTPGCGPERLWNQQVMAAQAAAAGSDVFVAKTSSLPRFDNFLHLTNVAELELGRAFGRLSLNHLS